MVGRIRRLTRLELENTLASLLGEEAAALVKPIEADASATKYSTGADRGVSANYVSDLSRVAQLAAAELQQASESAALDANCSLDDLSATACATTFIQTFGARAWRRPLTEVEVQELLVVYQSGRATAVDDEPGSALHAGLDYVVRALLQAPSFVFRTELGAADSGETLVSLTPFEAAAVLSYGLTASPPDAELTSHALDGSLSNAEALAAQGRRLLDAYPERYARQTELFVREWLGIDLAAPVWRKDAELYPRATDEFKTALDRETTVFLQDWARGSSFLELLTKPRGFVSQKNAWMYGIAEDAAYFFPGAPEFTAIDLDPRQRAGVLTLPSLLGSLAHEATSSPVMRGVMVMRKFLCLEPPPVPAVVPPLPPIEPGTPRTTRARYEQHTSVAFCATCHSVFDPMGYTFEHYDAVGGYRELENGVAVDSTGALVAGTGPVASVSDAIELS